MKSVVRIEAQNPQRKSRRVSERLDSATRSSLITHHSSLPLRLRTPDSGLSFSSLVTAIRCGPPVISNTATPGCAGRVAQALLPVLYAEVCIKPSAPARVPVPLAGKHRGRWLSPSLLVQQLPRSVRDPSCMTGLPLLRFVHKRLGG